MFFLLNRTYLGWSCWDAMNPNHKQSTHSLAFQSRRASLRKIYRNSYLPSPSGTAVMSCGCFYWRLLWNIYFIVFLLLYTHSLPTPTPTLWPHSKEINQSLPQVLWNKKKVRVLLFEEKRLAMILGSDFASADECSCFPGILYVRS